eukprot:351771-Chlamydomonas_euryale.AAC.6
MLVRTSRFLPGICAPMRCELAGAYAPVRCDFVGACMPLPMQGACVWAYDKLLAVHMLHA